jgi:hypothetical protein
LVDPRVLLEAVGDEIFSVTGKETDIGPEKFANVFDQSHFDRRIDPN